MTKFIFKEDCGFGIIYYLNDSIGGNRNDTRRNRSDWRRDIHTGVRRSVRVYSDNSSYR